MSETNADPSAPTSPPVSDARARAEARKARILERGSDRLAKITSTARGDEGAQFWNSASR